MTPAQDRVPAYGKQAEVALDRVPDFSLARTCWLQSGTHVLSAPHVLT